MFRVVRTLPGTSSHLRLPRAYPPVPLTRFFGSPRSARKNEPKTFTETVKSEYASSAIDSLSIRLPYESWLDRIGGSPLLEIEPGMYAKIEGTNPGGSVKDRALTALVINKFVTGELKANDSTLALVTSGWAGMSLCKLLQAISEENAGASFGSGFDLVLIIPASYKDRTVPSQIINEAGVTTYYGGIDEYNMAKLSGMIKVGEVSLVLEDGSFGSILGRVHQEAKRQNWILVDQHHDASSLVAHASTTSELLFQEPELTDVVCATGTGATAAGLRKYLPKNVRVHSRPAKSGTVDGLTDINAYDNFCNPESLVAYNCGELFTVSDATRHKDLLLSTHGINAGQSSGSCYWLAKHIKTANPNAKVAFICADGYVNGKDSYKSMHVGESNRYYSDVPLCASAKFKPTTSRTICGGSRRSYSSSRRLSADTSTQKKVDHIIIGGGPVGSATAWYLGETSGDSGESVMLIHDPANAGAHGDWSRLARLSLDGTPDELEASRHALELIDLVDEVQSYQSGEPVVPMRPGMLFVASPGTPMANACAHSEKNYGVPDFIRRHPRELEEVFPGNKFNLPDDTLCWTHPVGLCVSPLQLCSSQLKTAKAFGVDVKKGIAKIDMEGDLIKVTIIGTGEEFVTQKCYLFAGAQNKEILEDSLERNGNSDLLIPEFDDTYITGISTVRYRHVNHPANPNDGSNHIVPPIILGQLEAPQLVDFQANFSIVPEEHGDVLKTRLSGSIGREVIPYVKNLYSNIGPEEDAKMAAIYRSFFGSLFPFLETNEPLDFNRCVTYRNHSPEFSGTSLVEKVCSDSSTMITTVGCFGVGVKFGPMLGEAAAAHTADRDLHVGLHVWQSGDTTPVHESKRIESAW